MKINKFYTAAVAVILLWFVWQYIAPKIAPEAYRQASAPLSEHATSSDMLIGLGSSTIRAEKASTEAEREQGLSGRTGLAADEGLFFTFDMDGIWGIWMKDMLFPIDILWIDENLAIVGVKERADPKDFPEIYKSERPARYVLEINAGAFGSSGAKVGDTVSFLEK